VPDQFPTGIQVGIFNGSQRYPHIGPGQGSLHWLLSQWSVWIGRSHLGEIIHNMRRLGFLCVPDLPAPGNGLVKRFSDPPPHFDAD
jgi:hypothetical protein